jgi:glyoxylase-like metal-dependent hydrolase (beta-lactamase superfamily II)
LSAPEAEQCIVIDPGPLLEDHLEALSRKGQVRVILATHAHPDHVEGLPRFRELAPSGAVIPARDGVGILVQGGLRVEAMATPGHTSDSVCYLASYQGEQVVFTGDTILGRGTTVVAYPDGDLGDYLASLDKLAELGPLPVLPGHGPALSDCATAAQFYIDHRLARLEQIRAARFAGHEEPADIVAAVYADVDKSLWPAAQLSVEAQIAYLDREHR